MIQLGRLDLQSKIVLVLIGVIVPTFLLVTLLQYKLTKPILHAEMQQIGITTAQALATKIQSQHWLSRPGFVTDIDTQIQEQLYLQPSVVRVDVYARDPATGLVKAIASNVE